jgi:uncharacterized protein YigE (DUF2233 family)
MRATLTISFLLTSILGWCGEPPMPGTAQTPNKAGVGAVEFSQTRIGDKQVTVCRVSLSKAHVQLYLRDDAGQPIKRFDRLETIVKQDGRILLFAMNAGMFHSDFAPVGLFVADGKQASPLNTNSGLGNFFLKPNGVFAITERGARVVETSEFLQINDRVILATQSGPLLVHNGQIHPAFNASSQSRLIRNGVGVTASKDIVFAITEEPVNFHEFAVCFRDVLKCPDALFLDGVVSSLHATKLGRSDARNDLGPIIAVTE